MSSVRTTITAGIAMFAMFFGSGNLVFPIKVGVDSGQDYLVASVGILLTAVMVPFIGLISMIIYHGNRQKYFGLLGKWAPFTLSLLMLSLIGPFGVIPRCMLVAFGGLHLLLPEIDFKIFNLVFSLIILLIIYKKNSLIPIIGSWLGPFKIAGIVLIIAAAVYQGNAIETVVGSNYSDALMIGLVEGYQTMDLLAAFFFSITIVEYLNSVTTDQDEALRMSVIASIIGGVLIALVYYGLVMLGAYYASELKDLNPELYLPTVTNLTLGKYAAAILAATMILACLTTASTLSVLFAQFLKVDLLKNKISWFLATIVTIIISYLLSLIGFRNISIVLGQVLEILYPSLIVLSVLSIVNKYYKLKYLKYICLLVLIITLVL